MDLDTAYALLQTAPAEVLRRHPVRVIGSGHMPGVETVALFHGTAAATRPSSVFGTHVMRATTAFEIRTAAHMGPQQFTSVTTNQPLPHRVFPAHFVHMSPGLTSMESYRLPVDGPKIMVTPLLTGCSFVMEPAEGGAVRVTHVRPGGGVSGAQLPGAIAGQVGEAQIYGADDNKGTYDSADRVVNIIGVLTDSGWVIYAQKMVRNSDAIVDVYQIYPERKKL